MNVHVAAQRAFPTITSDHPHRLRTSVREIATGERYVVLGIVIWSADHFDACDEVICAPIRDGAMDFTTWHTFKEFELEAA